MAFDRSLASGMASDRRSWNASRPPLVEPHGWNPARTKHRPAVTRLQAPAERRASRTAPPVRTRRFGRIWASPEPWVCPHRIVICRSGASIMEAKELARHADIRQTAKYTHIGMEDRAEALGNLPSPDVSAHVDRLRIVCVSGGVLGQEVSPHVSEADQDDQPRNEQTPDCSGVVSSSVVNCHQKAVYIEVEAAGLPGRRRICCHVRVCVEACRLIGPVIGNQPAVPSGFSPDPRTSSCDLESRDGGAVHRRIQLAS